MPNPAGDEHEGAYRSGEGGKEAVYRSPGLSYV